MASILGKMAADFSTSLATKVAVGGTTATLQSATDDDGVALPTGTYFLTVDGSSSNKEYWQCTLTGTALTAIRNITRQGTQTSGSVREHRVGANVKITNFAHLKYINDLLNGDATIDADLVFSSNDLTGVQSIAGLATPTSGETTKAANVAYVNSVAIAGVPDAADNVKGAVEIATQAEVDAGDDSGSTTAPVVVKPSTLAVAVQDQTFLYGESGGIAAVMTFTPVPAITALAAGQRHSVKMTTACTGACTLAVSGLTAKNVKKYVAGAIADPEANDWIIGSIADFEYDGTQYILLTPPATGLTSAVAYEAQQFFSATNISGAEAETLSDGSNADTLHTHGISPEQEIPYFVSSTTAYASNMRFNTNTDGSIGVLTTWNGADFNIFRLARDSKSQQYVLTHTTSFTGTTINECSPMVTSTYIYVEYDDNGTNAIKRYDLADLANVQAMTRSGDDWNTGNASFTDGTNLYVYTSSGVFNKYSISGTTYTFVSTFTYTTSGTVSNGGATCDGTSVWTNENTNGSITIRKYALAGGSASSSVVRLIYRDVYPNPSGLRLFIPKAGTLGIAHGYTNESNAAVVGSAVRLMTITQP